MSQELIDLGTAANDRTGDTWRRGGEIINDNFTQLFSGDTSGFFQWSFVPQISLSDPGIANFCLDNVDISLAENISTHPTTQT